MRLREATPDGIYYFFNNLYFSKNPEVKRLYSFLQFNHSHGYTDN
jgi:hypothetical protein